jgi:hypothetical protein
MFMVWKAKGNKCAPIPRLAEPFRGCSGAARPRMPLGPWPPARAGGARLYPAASSHLVATPGASRSACVSRLASS